MRVYAFLFFPSALLVLWLLFLNYRGNRRLREKADEMSRLQARIAEDARTMYQAWQERDASAMREEHRAMAAREANVMLQQWKADAELSIRQDAIMRSQSVTLGKVSEHLAPFMSVFPYDPKDTRFIGSPIDLLVFDGLEDNDLRDVVFIEIKTGSSALSQRQRQIKQAILEGRVVWREMRLN